MELSTPRFYLNREKFFYNPISLNSKTIKLFPNIQTLHLYEKNDYFLKCQRISRYVVWYKIDFTQFKNNKNDKIQYKNVKLRSEDIKDMQLVSQYTIPDSIKSLERGCFSLFTNLTQINIPTSITKLPTSCFGTWRYGCNFKTFTIPTHIKEVGELCFQYCQSLTEIIIPTTLKELSSFCFFHCLSLRKISIPTSITKLPQNCFERCEFSEFTIPSHIKQIEKDCFLSCYFPLFLIHFREGCREILQASERMPERIKTRLPQQHG